MSAVSDISLEPESYLLQVTMTIFKHHTAIVIRIHSIKCEYCYIIKYINTFQLSQIILFIYRYRLLLEFGKNNYCSHSITGVFNHYHIYTLLRAVCWNQGSAK